MYHLPWHVCPYNVFVCWADPYNELLCGLHSGHGVLCEVRTAVLYSNYVTEFGF